MVFTFIVLWIISIILIVNDPKKESTRWVALVTFCGGTGGFARALIEEFLPYLKEYQLLDYDLESLFRRVYSFGSFINTNGLPYAFLVFCICYSDLFHSRTKNILKCVLFIPIIFMLYSTPMFPVLKHNYHQIIIWVGPYILIGSGLLLYSYFKETNPITKKSRLFTNVVALPPVLFQLFSNYTLRLFHIDEMWRLNSIMICVLLVLFIILITKFDFFGIKLRFEKRRINSTLKAVTSGTSILNHTIKNEVGKINILAENIQYMTRNNGLMEAHADAAYIMASTKHLLGMVNRIQIQIQEIHLIKESNNLSIMLNECVDLNQPLITKRNINVEEIYAVNKHVKCDNVHFKEVISNLITNAVEAMTDGGQLKIETYELRNKANIVIKDNGIGISKQNLQHVFDPFFTTKLRNHNFGLGLSYCYNVVQKHGGKIEIFSEVNEGTTVKISIPISQAV